MLVVIAGLPGTGKTTLSRRLATEMSAAVVRLDAVETAIVRSGELKPPLGPVGYLVAQAVVTGCLEVGTPVVVDAVSPVAEARAGWRRVEQRRSDLEGLVVPTWDRVRQGIARLMPAAGNAGAADACAGQDP